MNSPVPQIKERLSIEDVVSSYIKLEKSGANLRARCPFHNEKTPSFFISPGRGSYYCFGCGASGDIFSFVEEFEGLDFKGALKLLAERAGISLAYSKEAESEKEKLHRAMEEAATFFSNNLKERKDVEKYIEGRGITEASGKDFRIGFARDEWQALYDHLKRKGFNDVEIEKAGLAKKSEKGFYDRFRNRVVFPIFDSSGRVIAFSGRIFVDDGKSAKYLNSPDTPIFSKGEVLYGLHRAKESIRKNNFSILVEGQMDLVLSHQAGFRNTVATSGTALSDSTVSKENAVSNLGLVRRLSENIVLAFDADKAGFNASLRAGQIALSLGMDVKVAAMPEGVDPADLISKEGVDAWKKAIRDSKHLVEFLLEKVLKSYKDDGRKAGREIKEKVLPYVSALSSSIEQMHFIKKISEASQIPENALKDDLKKVVEEQKYEKKEIEIAESIDSKMFRKDYILRKLLGIIFWQKNPPDQLVVRAGQKDKMIDTDAVLKSIGEILNKDPGKILEEAQGEAEDLIFEAEVFYGNGENLDKDVKEMLGNLEGEYLKEKLAQKMKQLNMAEGEKDISKSSLILKEISEITNKIESMKSGRSK